ncbi:UDP-N-acetylmuramate dehydrogenase [Metallumcola ferriviriculae]|uniref:UDP-N-acetylenolpyruvoylglucosamine reductase n=1 Tax=Metallumcola ferriviriculae TaxID=3039180 RepID=A0AAU0ULK9_9FIRM|nr:UDP-N-acetylmuramate dehydrogenase [Desulfitibacteraceae bacterium MK1]
MSADLFRQLKFGLSGKCLQNEPLAKYTTWRVGGAADFYAEAENEDDVLFCLDFVERHHLPLTLIGNGSNLLVLDGGVRGVVMRLGGEFNKVSIQGTEVIAGAATILPRLSREAASHQLSGLEFAVGIPASLGGAVVMNAGIPGNALEDIIKAVRVINKDGQKTSLSREELGFGYRSSKLYSPYNIVLQATLQLKRGRGLDIWQKMERLLEQRKDRQPISSPNAGSVFKNPPDYTAGYLIEKAGLKEAECGDAKVSLKHANFIVNEGKASAQEILSLIKTIQEEVEQKFNICLEPEVHVIGDEK